MIGLTPRQSACLHAIEDLTVDGVSPTFEMIGGRIGVTSKSVIHRLVLALEERGHIRRRAHRPRALEVVAAGTPAKTKKQIADEVVRRAYEAKKSGHPATREVLHKIVMEALR